MGFVLPALAAPFLVEPTVGALEIPFGDFTGRKKRTRRGLLDMARLQAMEQAPDIQGFAAETVLNRSLMGLQGATIDPVSSSLGDSIISEKVRGLLTREDARRMQTIAQGAQTSMGIEEMARHLNLA